MAAIVARAKTVAEADRFLSRHTTTSFAGGVGTVGHAIASVRKPLAARF